MVIWFAHSPLYKGGHFNQGEKKKKDQGTNGCSSSTWNGPELIQNFSHIWISLELGN